MGTGKTELGRVALEKRQVSVRRTDDHGDRAWRAEAAQAGVRIIDLRRIRIELDLLNLIPREIADAHRVLPLRAQEGKLAVVMTRPANVRVRGELSFVTGMEVVPFAADPRQITEAIGTAYQAHRRGERYYDGADYQATADTGDAEPEPSEFERVPLSDSAANEPPESGPSLQAAASGEDAEFVIPDLFAKEGAATLPLVQAEDVRGSKGTLLIVSPSQDQCGALARVVGERSWEVVTALGASQVKAAIQRQALSGIVLETELSGMHGFELLARLRRHYESLPVVVLAGPGCDWRLAKDVRETYSVQFFLQKPLDEAQLGFAVDCCDVRFQEDATFRSQSYLDEGLVSFKAGNWETAIRHFSLGLSCNPCSAELHLHQGLVQRELRHSFKAIASLERAHFLDPSNFIAVKHLAMLYQAVDFRTKAAEMWQRALLLAPNATATRSIREQAPGWTKANS